MSRLADIIVTRDTDNGGAVGRSVTAKQFEIVVPVLLLTAINLTDLTETS
jgi:hypothetical protein